MSVLYSFEFDRVFSVSVPNFSLCLGGKASEMAFKRTKLSAGTKELLLVLAALKGTKNSQRGKL